MLLPCTQLVRFLFCGLTTLSILSALVIPPATAQNRPASSRSSSTSSKSSSSASSIQCDKDRDGTRAIDGVCGGKDCNDADPEVNPNRLEISASSCQDGKDNDCNGLADCSDLNCAGKPTFVPGVFSLKPSGMCCMTGHGGEVVDSSNDPKNCGGCGVVCDSHDTCVKGRCISGCDLSKTVCFKDPIPFEVPVERDSGGNYPSQIQAIIDGIRNNPDCPRPSRRDPTFDIKYFSEPLLDNRGKPTGQSLRGVCVTMNF